MVPKILPQTSFEACILRAILSVQSCGTWQSGQLARTPERFVKCGVRCSSWKTLLRISWHEVQNFSVLVISSAVLKAPQNNTPQTKPPSARKPRLRCALGRLAMRQNQIRSDLSRCICRFSLLLGADEKHVLERAGNERLRVRLLDVAGGAEVAPGRHVG